MHAVRISAAFLAILLAGMCSDTVIGLARSAPPESRPGRPYALVIGVTDYAHFPHTPRALDHARKIAALLETGGFEVLLLQNPSAVELKTALETLVQASGRQSERDIVLYYGGQTISWVTNDGTQLGWIIPRDCPQPADQPDQFERQAVSTRSIEAYAGQMQSRRVIMFFDAALAGDSFALETPALRMGSRRNPRPVRQYIIAGGPDETIGDHDLFTDTLVQALHGQADAVYDGLITGSELAVYMANRISQATHGQVNPLYGKSRDPALSQGDFVFDAISMPAGSRLYVLCQPAEARIRILNIKPKFTQGISLAPGKYRIEAAAAGYASQRKWITLAAGRDEKISIQLEKIVPIQVNTMGMAMKWIDNQDFFMGSPDDEPGRQADEQMHWVRLDDGFRMQTTEVSVGQFNRFVDSTGYRTEAEKNGGCWALDTTGRWQLQPQANWKTAGPWMESKGKQRDQFPVTCVSWNDAMAYARWLSDQEGRIYDLPSEAQWELACRAGTRTPFAFGQCLDLRSANYAAAGPYFARCGQQPHTVHPGPEPVNGRLKNKWDLADMHGNAAEWCRDWYGPYAKDRGRGAEFGTERVIRGGHFASLSDQCRSAKRSSFKPDAAANVIGFRLVQLPSP